MSVVTSAEEWSCGLTCDIKYGKRWKFIFLKMEILDVRILFAGIRSSERSSISQIGVNDPMRDRLETIGSAGERLHAQRGGRASLMLYRREW